MRGNSLGKSATSSEMPDDVLRGHVRELFGRVVYSHKTHEKDRERYTARATWAKSVNVVLSGITFGGAAAVVGMSTPGTMWFTAGFATLNAAFAVVQLSFDPNRQAGLHRDAAKQLLRVRDDYITLIADIKSGAVDAATARHRRDLLQGSALGIYETAPDTTGGGYQKARRALQSREEMTFSSAEIDSFLPVALRENAESS